MKSLLLLSVLLIVDHSVLVASRFPTISSAVPKWSRDALVSSSNNNKSSENPADVESLLFKLFSGKKKTEQQSSTDDKEQQNEEKKNPAWQDTRKPAPEDGGDDSLITKINQQRMDRKKRQQERKIQNQKFREGKQKDLEEMEKGGTTEGDDGVDDIVYTKTPEQMLERKTRQEERKLEQQKAREEKERAQEERKLKQQKAREEKQSAQEEKKKKAQEGKQLGSKKEKVSKSKKSIDKSDEEASSDIEEKKETDAGKTSEAKDEAPSTSTPVANVTESEASISNPADEIAPKTPTFLVMGSQGPPGPPTLYRAPPSGRQQPMMPPGQTLAVTAIASLASVVARLWVVVWITKKLALEEESINPVQHFVWECLNDRYSRDNTVLTKTLSKPPAGFSQRKWNKYLKSTRSAKTVHPGLPSKTVVVIDVTPHNQLDLLYLSDVVTFLIGSHNKQMFGTNPEVVLLVRSPGGEVTAYGLAAAQVARLQQTGMDVTVCIDNIAASGGYMIASQSSQIVAAPFAMVGSIGVMREGLNYNKILNDYGIKPLVIKAGEMKNPLSMYGPVTDKDIQEETERLEKVHNAFIDLCLSRRPSLDVAVCDGTVLIGSQALDSGMVDRVLTSDEYIWEKITDGDYVLKLHKSNRDHDHVRMFARALDVLPHLRQRISGKNFGVAMSRIFQGAAFTSMIHRALCRYFDEGI